MDPTDPLLLLKGFSRTIDGDRYDDRLGSGGKLQATCLECPQLSGPAPRAFGKYEHGNPLPDILHSLEYRTDG